MQRAVYHSHAVQAWEQRWFGAGNSALGLMQQAAWQMAQLLHSQIFPQRLQGTRHFALEPSSIHIAVYCGVGNNAGDGYFVASYLQQMGYVVDVFAPEQPVTPDAKIALHMAQQTGLNINSQVLHQQTKHYDVHIDALFGIGLNRELSADWQGIIQHVNTCVGLKIALDIPSGLAADSGHVFGTCVQADHTLTVLAYKIGLFTGQGKQFAGQLYLLPLIPTDADLQPWAQICPDKIVLPKRVAHGHKGNYGHVLVIGGHAEMGGAAIMSSQAAFAAGAGKVTVACAAKHHVAILARSPNVMVKDIDQLDDDSRQQLLAHVDSVCFGMGLGRDAWAAAQFTAWFPALLLKDDPVVMDADALWFLAQPETLNACGFDATSSILKPNCIATPHSGEAATLLGCSAADVERDRVAAITQLRQRYAGQWVLKGAGSLVLEDDTLFVCTSGNAGMGTGGMGDVLAGMISSLSAQFGQGLPLAHMVQLHGLAGDVLAAKGERGIQACDMPSAIYTVVNDIN